MKTLKELLIQLNERSLFESEENKGWKYKALEPQQQARTRAIGAKVRAAADEANKAARKKDVESRAAEAKQAEGKAAKWGIPYIQKMAKGSDDGEGKIVSVSVDGHDDDGKIWFHQGSYHFRHPSGKTHNEVTLQKSGMGIAVMPKVKPGQKVVKAVAHLPPSRNAIEDRDFTHSGKTLKRK